MKNRKKTYVIAEIGINHNGSLDNCYRLIDAAADAGCNCVKFQFFNVRYMYPRSAGRLAWRDARRMYSYNIYTAVKSFQLPAKWIKLLMRYCKRKRIDFLSSVFDIRGATYLLKSGMKMVKLPSYAITNLPLIEHCARFNLPIIISTGGATMGEIEDAVKVVNMYHKKLSLLHCSIKYPTSLSECNLGIINTLHYAFPEIRIGYSDHTKEVSKAAVEAIYIGAVIIEKHITLDKNMKGPDHFFALEPHELKEMVKDVRKAEKDFASGNIRIDKTIYGSTEKIIFKHERYLRDFCFTTIFAGRDIKKGERIRYKDLRLLRPGRKKRGLEPKHLNLFKKYRILATEDIAEEEPVTWEKLFNA